MAYDARQRQIMAYALALSGGNVAAAVRWLKSNSVECDGISESTLRRLRDDAEFETEIEHQQTIIREERDAQIREAERSRMRGALEGTFLERMRSMERRGWELFEKISKDMDQPGADKKQMLAFWRAAQGYVIDLRKQAGGGIHELWQAEVLVRATREVLQAELGLAMADKLVKEIGKKYDVMAAQRQAQEAEHAAPETASA